MNTSSMIVHPSIIHLQPHVGTITQNLSASLRNLARHDIKITLLLATASTLLVGFVVHYLGLGNYKVIGELDQYLIPDVVISV